MYVRLEVFARSQERMYKYAAKTADTAGAHARRSALRAAATIRAAVCRGQRRHSCAVATGSRRSAPGHSSARALPEGPSHSGRAHWCSAPLVRPSTRACATAAASEQKPMEVEVKIRLPNQAAYDTLAKVLEPGKRATYKQENYFFDGSQQELESKRCVLRLRFYNGEEKVVITCKGEQVLRDGIGQSPEVEEPLTSATQRTQARGWLTQPDDMMKASPLLQSLNTAWGITQLVCLGGFRNLRTEYTWEGLTLELDCTQYDWGTLYEIECETSDPEAVRDRLEALLKSHNISYSYSKTSKFANFIKKTLL